MALAKRFEAPVHHWHQTPVRITLLGLLAVSMQLGQPGLAFTFMVATLASVVATLWTRAPGAHHPVAVLRQQGDVALRGGQYVQAKLLYERALSAARRHYASDAYDVLINIYQLALTHSMLGEHDDAEHHMQALVVHTHGKVPQAWRGHLAWALRRAARHACTHGHHARARRLCELALGQVGEAPGADNLTVRSLLDDYAWVHHHAGNYPFAQTLFEQALALHDQLRDIANEALRPHANRATLTYRTTPTGGCISTGGLDRAVAHSLLGLAWNTFEQGDFARARRSFARGCAVLEDGLSVDGMTNHRLRVELLRGQGAIATTLGAYREAHLLYAEARTYLHAPNDVPHVALQLDEGWLARCEGYLDDAERIYQGVHERLATLQTPSPILRAALLHNQADLCRRQGRADEGHMVAQQALCAMTELWVTNIRARVHHL